MRTLLFFSGLLPLALALQEPIFQQQQPWDKYQPPQENLGQIAVYQQKVLNLLLYVNQPNYYPELEDIGLSYDIQANVQNYRNPKCVEEFFRLYTVDVLTKGQIFSIFYEQHQKEAIAFFRLLYNAVDFDTLYKTAAWGRMFLNEALYIYSLSVALVHRPDTYYIQLPPIYEIYPYYFYNVDVFQQVQQKIDIPVGNYGVYGQRYWQQLNDSSYYYEYGQKSYKYPYYFGKYTQRQQRLFQFQGSQQGQQQESNGVVIEANYIQYDNMQNSESVMSYYTEDVGLNAFYYYYNIYFPSWMKNEEILFNTERRGEQFYYIYQQLLARYNLERISNRLPEIPVLDYGSLLSGYRPGLVYPNGIPFPSRPDNAPVVHKVVEADYNNNIVGFLNYRLYEDRLLHAIDSGFVLGKDGKLLSIFEPGGFEILGDIIQSNPQSPNVRYYGDFLVIARNILGYANYPTGQYYIAPSVLEQYETSLRDPAFYQLYKGVIYFFQRYKQFLPTYGQKELLLSSVKIVDVKVDKLVTYFDYFYSDISNIAVPQGKSPEVPIRIKQYRLNHKPFNYYLNVVSDQSTEVVVRAFLGPKYDVSGKLIDINNNRLNFVELDKFQYSLVPGLNVIERNCREFYGYVQDHTSYKELFMQLINYKSLAEVVPRTGWGMPQRLLLPRGTKEGQVYQMYFLITSYQPVQKYIDKMVQPQQPLLYWDVIYDSLPCGYPFDRPIDEYEFYVPNSYFQDVVIYNEFDPIKEYGQQI